MDQTSLNKALADHQQGNLAGAEAAYLHILKDEPDNADVLHLLAILYGQQNAFEKALPYIQQALTLTPDSATYHNSMGNIQKNLDHIDEAIEHYQTALTLNPNSISAHNNLASIFFKTNATEKAIEHYKQALALNPNFIDSNYNLALVYLQQEDYPRAKKHLNKCIALDQTHHQALATLGKIALHEKNYDSAIKLLKQSLKQFKDNVDALVNLGAALLKEGKFEDATACFKKAIKLEPQHFEAHYNLGCTYLNLHDPKKALTHFMQILTQEPNPELYYNIGVIYMYQDRHSEAINYLQEAIKYQPDYLDALINLGVTFLKMGHHDKAIEYFDKALTLNPNNIEVQYILSALQGDQLPKKAPEDYIRHLFDQYAPYYEKHLTEFLHYDTPKHMLAAVKATLPNIEQLTIVDLGCGTGLTGELFKPLSRKLIGIDLSMKMIEIATKKNLYDDLHIADIHVTLTSLTNIDLIIAGDVISYLGDLTETFTLIKHALKPQGHFVFSIESANNDDKDYQLQKTARFTHSRQYIKRLASEHHFECIYEQQLTLRHQKNQPVEGMIFILKAQDSA